jgi:DedD protein
MMEKKKLLLVAISVGVFLVVVIGASILVFSPRSPSSAAAARINPIPAGNPAKTEISVSPVDMVKNTLASQGLKSASDAAPPENMVYIYGENPGNTLTVERPGSDSGNRVIVDVMRPTAVAVPNAPPPVAAKPAAAPAAAAPKAVAPKAAAPKAAAPKAAALKAAAPKAAAPKTAAPKPASAGQPKIPDNFWVQTGSFSTIARAEAAKDTLASKSITAIIENRNVEGKTFFRVRVGPYTSKNEADYWRELIKEFNGFEESLVLQSPVAR